MARSPRRFEEFYKYWADNINSAYQKVLLSDDFSKLVGHMVEAMSEFKKVYDKLFELWLTNMPVPKVEMDSLCKTVYDLKKELRALKAKSPEMKPSAVQPCDDAGQKYQYAEVAKMKPSAVQSGKAAETTETSKSK